MKTLFLSLVVVVCGVGLVRAERGPGDPWTLADAVAQAVTASPDARLALARVESVRALRAQAEGAALPRLDLRASYLQTNNPMQGFGVILGTGTFDNTLNFNAPGQVDALTAGLYARYALYTGGRVTAGRAAARAAESAAEADREAALADLSLEVVRAYFGIRQADGALMTLTATLAAYDEALRVGRLREAAGQLLASDRLNLEVQRSQVQEQLLAARHGALLTRRNLAFLLGLPAGTDVVLVNDDAGPARLVATTGAPTDRPEWRAMQQRREAAEKQLRAARGARLPSVGAFAGAQTDRGWRRDGHGESWTAGIQAELPIFDGAESSAKSRGARADLAQLDAAAAKLELALALDLERARLAVELARERLSVSEARVGQAEESARLSREQFAAGKLLSAEVIGVETRLAEARLQRIDAVATERVAIAALRRAAGQPILP